MNLFTNKNHIYVLISGFIWGTSFPAITIGLQYTSPESLLFFRFFTATIICFILFPETIKKLGDFDLVLIGLFNGFAYLLQFMGQKNVPAGQASILVNLYTILIPLISIFLLKEKLNKNIFVTIVLGFCGVLFLTYNQLNSTGVNNQEYLIGVLALFFAGVSWASYVVYSKKVQIKLDKSLDKNVYSYKDIFSATLFYTSIIAFFSILFSSNTIPIYKIEFIIIFMYLAVFGSFFAFILYLKALENIKASTISILSLSEVFVSYGISVAFLGEEIGLIQFLGVILILISILVIVNNDSTNLNIIN